MFLNLKFLISIFLCPNFCFLCTYFLNTKWDNKLKILIRLLLQEQSYLGLHCLYIATLSINLENKILGFGKQMMIFTLLSKEVL